MAETPAAAPEAATKSPIKKGSLVRVSRNAYANSLEAQASDTVAPDYIFEGPAEVLVIKGNYAQLRFRRPVPDVWLRADQLESV
ncbi:MAG: NAD(P)H-quinone oxidoreductase [Cyanobacteria bacterium M_surface_10_m2_179]|nr:NAD(P)H-quinone oxidoreductase [Cyanobacteria bacterium M_surface_10_m2_179]